MKLLLCVIVISCTICCFSQESIDASYKRFGFFAGVNAANMNFNKGVPAPATKVKASWKSGIIVGFLVRVPLAENLYLQPEYSYSQRKGADKLIETSYSFHYLSLPVFLKYKISSLLSVVAGPQAELLILANANKNGVKSNITHDVEERSIGAAAGVEFSVKNNFNISARYLHGLNHIGIGQRSDVKEFKYEVVNLSAGISF